VIALDTNVLVRLLVEDDAKQLALAKDAVKRAEAHSELLLVCDIVLCELEWVLESAYRVPRKRIAAAIQTLLGDQRFTFESRERCVAALEHYSSSKADLSDSLLGLQAEEQGARTTLTFDRGLRSDQRFTVL
jgi:predicted nucleic-acid-binding protein